MAQQWGRRACWLLAGWMTLSVYAGPLRDRWLQRREAAPVTESVVARQAMATHSYGGHRQQTLDIYKPAQGGGLSPVLLMVHGGGWAYGDKAHHRVVENKVQRWLPKGVALVSVNYRMLPDASPLEQARDVARAVAWLQSHGVALGLDVSRLVLMGHSAGAHLVALVSARESLVREAGGEPRWLGVVSLDNATLDVQSSMRARHLPLYDRAFGTREEDWREASPLAHLDERAAGRAWLLVCSGRRAESCPQAMAFAERVQSFGGRAQVLPQDLSHSDINEQLGRPGEYTAAVEAFLASIGFWAPAH